jgi:hypothetical protein
VSRRLKGAKRVKSLLNRIEPAMREEIATALKSAGGDILALMKAEAPVLSRPVKGRVQGALRDALSMKFYPNTLRLRVGFVGKPANRRAFYARFLEFGRGIKRTTDTLGRKIGVLPPALIIFGNRPLLRSTLGRDIRGIWKRALDKAAAGASGDD